MEFREADRVMRMPHSIRERMPDPKTGPALNPRVLSMLNTNQEIKIADLSVPCVGPTLPGVVHNSPLLALLAEDTWLPRYVPFLEARLKLSQMCTLLRQDVVPKLDAKVKDAAFKTYDQEAAYREEAVMNQIEKINDDEGLTLKEKVTAFLMTCERFNVQHLNQLERVVHTCLVGEKNIPFAMCKTPIEPASYHVSFLHDQDKERFWTQFCLYWETKVLLVNQHMEAHCRVKPTQFITVQGLREAHTQVSPDELWNGYLTPKTATEYYQSYGDIKIE